MNAIIRYLMASLLVLCASGTFRTEAQTTFALPFSLTQSSPALTFSMDSNGTFDLKGPLNTATTFNYAGSPQLFWIPSYGALRAGWFNSTNTQSSQTTGQYSVALGYNSAAVGTATMAFGYGAAAVGNNSIGIGPFTYALGYSSLSMGDFSLASGSESVAIGGYVTSSGANSTAFGWTTTSSGTYSTAAGLYTTANSYDSSVLGTYNTGLTESGSTPSATTWVSTDPLFELGNGTSSTKSDALVVYKDGTAKFAGAVTVPQSGDIPMYTGN